LQQPVRVNIVAPIVANILRLEPASQLEIKQKQEIAAASYKQNSNNYEMEF